MDSQKRVLSELNEIKEKLIDLSEGYLGEFEDDPEASAKSYIDGLLDSVRSTINGIKDLYK